MLRSPAAVPVAVPAPIVEGNTAFALDLYAKLRTKQGNVFYSPYSISAALSMTSAGAAGETLAEMTRVLHLPADQSAAHAGFDALRQQLRTQITAKGAGASFPSWPAYVRSQAALGDAEAIALLQRWRTRSQRQNPSPFRNAPSNPALGAKPPPALSRLNDASYHPARLVQALSAFKIQRRPASRRASRR